MKNVCKFFVISVLALFAESAFSMPVDPRDVIDDAGNATGDLVGYTGLEVEDTTYFKLCEIRRFFCGTTKTVIVATAIVILGLLVIMGKIKWTHVIVVLAGVSIFSSAEYFMISLTTLPPNLGVIYSCYCIEGMTDLFTGG